MNPTLHHRNLWSLDGLSGADVLALIQCALALKRATQAGLMPAPLRGKYIALLSDDHTSAGAASFQRAAAELGAQVARVRASDPGGACERRDPRDTAGLLGRLYDAIDCEGMADAVVRQIERDAGVPVFNGIGAFDHPTRVLADLMTAQECCGLPLDEISFRFIGDPQSQAGTVLAQAVDLAGADLQTLTPGVGDSAGDLAVLSIAKAAIACEPSEGGRLPLRLCGLSRAAKGKSLADERAINQRCMLQALLVSAMG